MIAPRDDLLARRNAAYPRPAKPSSIIAQVDGSGIPLISVWPRLISCPNGVSVNTACSVIENGPLSLTDPPPSWLKLSAKVTAVWLKVSIKIPGVSVGVSAPWLLAGSSNQLKAIADPRAFCHVPAPAVEKKLTGPMPQQEGAVLIY